MRLAAHPKHFRKHTRGSICFSFSWRPLRSCAAAQLALPRIDRIFGVKTGAAVREGGLAELQRSFAGSCAGRKRENIISTFLPFFLI